MITFLGTRRSVCGPARILLHFSLVAVLLAGAHAPACAQKKPPVLSKEEARALVNRVSELTNLRSPGSAPFHLHATVKSFGPKAQGIEGTYELWWASSERWREEIDWADKKFVRLAENDQLWVEGEDTHRLNTLHLSEVFEFWSRLRISPGRSIDRVQSKRIDGVSMICIRSSFHTSSTSLGIMAPAPLVILGPPNLDQSGCLDAATDLPLRIDRGHGHLELGSYSRIGPKQFPQSLHELREGKDLIEAQVDVLETFDTVQSNAFAPPKGGNSTPWCSNMILPEPRHFGATSGSASLPGGGLITPLPTEAIGKALVVFRVNETGRTVRVHAFDSRGEISLKDSERRVLLLSEFQPATCLGKVIEADFLLRQE